MKSILPFLFLLLTGCEQATTAGDAGATEPRFEMTGKLESKHLDEASGLQAGRHGVFFVHNDEGSVIYAIDATGRDLGRMKVRNAGNNDWEDITRVMGDDGPLLVIGDTGDNLGARKKVRLYFVNEPAVDELGEDLAVAHRLDVRYPDGPRDVESLAYDPSGDMLLLLTKRDQPPRLYGIPLDLALWEDETEAVFLAEVPGFRPPSRLDILRNPGRGLWVSQPTGMDISPDGKTAAVITYRSLYIFRRETGETWAQAFQRQPAEYVGPPGSYEEAVSFGHEAGSVFVTTERRPAPVYRLNYE